MNQAGRQQLGLTLVELMVAMVISLMLVGALVGFYLNSSNARSEIDRSSRQIENGRFAIDQLRDDLALAGYYGEISPNEVQSRVDVDPCANSLNAIGWPTAAASAAQVPLPVRGPQEGSTTVPGSCGTLNQRSGTGFLVVRRLNTNSILPSAAAANTFYVQSNGCYTQSGKFLAAAGPGATNFSFKGSDCAAASNIREVISRVYYVSTCGICSPSDGVPTLKMRELRGNSIVETIVADGIEDLQFEFGRDTNGDGVVDDFVGTAAVAGDWTNVLAVRVRLISRGAEASPGYTDDKTYNRGNLFTTYTPAVSERGFKRRAYTTLVQLPNVAGPRENP